MNAVQQCVPALSVLAVCLALGLARASFYRHSRPRLIGPRKGSARALNAMERGAVLLTLNSERFCDLAPAQVYATLLDEGTYLCSERTMYRVLSDNAQVKERRDHARRPNYAAPQLLARRPKELWSWDITKLLGPVKWSYFHLYVILDVFSRYIVGWMVAPNESAALAQMRTETYVLQSTRYERRAGESDPSAGRTCEHQHHREVSTLERCGGAASH